MMKRILPLLLFLSGLFSITFAQTPGSLDLSFNKTGHSFFGLKANSTDDYATATLLQPDGKLLVAGYYNSSIKREGFVTRWLANGKPDLTFGTKGKAVFRDLGIHEFVANAMTLQSNGNIVLAGHVYQSSNESIPAITCLKADGSINTQFGNEGFKSFYEILPGLPATLNTVHIHPSTGHIIACGQTTGLESGIISSMLVIGINRYGNSFFSDSLTYRTYEIGGFSSNITSAVQFHADSLYLGVNQYGSDGFNHMGITAVSMVTGQLNDFFGAENTLLLSSDNDNTYCSSIALTSEKDILLGGSSYDGSTSKMLVYKITATKEAVDNSFGTNGQALIQMPSSTYQRISSIAVDQNNKIIIGGYYRASNDMSYWAAARLTGSGQLDPGFGTKTFAVEDEENVGIAAIQALPGGDYILAGSSNVPTVNSDVRLKKISNSGGDVLTYGKNSEVSTWARDYKSTGQDMALRSDGKLWVCGIVPSNSDLDRQSGIALLNADGTPDESFGGAGQAMPGVYLVPLTINSQVLYGLQLTSIKLQGTKLLVAGTFYEGSLYHHPILMRFIVSGNTLIPDNTFGTGGTGIVTLYNGYYSNYVQGLVLQNNENILVYGYFTDNNHPGVLCYTKDGQPNSAFADAGMYTSVLSSSSEGDVGKTMDLKSLPDNSILGVTSSYNGVAENDDFLVFRLASNGAEISNNLYDLSGDDYAYSLAVKPDGSYFVGGSSGGRYAIMAFEANDNPDTDFGTSGRWTLDKGMLESIVGLQIDGQKLVALGMSFDQDQSTYSRSVLRLTMAGKLDDTFYGKGYYLYGTGWAHNSVIANNRLYAVGPDRKMDGVTEGSGLVDRLYLGTGPSIKTTHLNLPNLVKTYGDEPFKIPPVTNSPAPVTYTIQNTFGICASVDEEGVFTILCATSSDNHILVKAYQPAISGYTEATANSIVYINKAVPKIIFPKQGGLIGEVITLQVATNSDATYSYFSQLSSNGVVQFVDEDKVQILAEGEEELLVTFDPSTNFLGDTLRTTVYGYVNPVAPEANDDQAELIYGQSASVTFNVLQNDAAYTGTLQPQYIDLDLLQPGVQNTYVSSSLGLFVADTNGFVTYTPFSGFIGSGAIEYTVRDSRGGLSPAAKIFVSVALQGEAPALKATELFTPNNDGLNDDFVIGFVDLEKENRLVIFDRNGAELFSQNNYKNDWNGDLPNGKKAENGIYYYLFIENSSGSQRELKGVVELKR